MVKNLWSVVAFCCGNHEELIQMELKEGPHSVFYACPRYSEKYMGGTGCPNRMSTVQAEEILNLISEKMEKAAKSGKTLNLTHAKFTYQGVECHIIEHTDHSIVVKVKNNRVFIRKK